MIELADDLRSTRGPFVKMDMGGYEPPMEGPWVFKRNGLYYFTMPENHHSIVQYRGQWLLFYHRWLEVPGAACRKKQRHVAAEPLHFSEDGLILKVSRTSQGVGALPGVGGR